MTISDRLFPVFSDNLPRINRCRDYHLYDGRGKRFLDMFLAGGTALFGHRPSGMSLRVRNTMAKGLFAAYPNAWTGRLIKELNSLFPEHPEVLIFSSHFEAEHWLHEKFQELRVLEPVNDSLCSVVASASGDSSISCSLWRPFCPGQDIFLKGGVAVLIPVLPFPGGMPGILCCTPGTASAEDLKNYGGDRIPPFITAGLVQAAALIRKMPENEIAKGAESGPGASVGKGSGKAARGGEVHPSLRRLELPGWERRGPYLRYSGSGAAYKHIFARALEKRILLPPNPDIPAIIPGLYSRGEILPLLEISEAP